MTIKARWKLSEDEQHSVSLDLQKCERQIRRLADLNGVTASLRIDYDADPTIVSDLLGLIADSVSLKGDVLFDKDRWEVRSDRAFWTLSSEGRLKENDIESHLNWIISQLSGSLPNLRKLQNLGARTLISIHSESWSRLQYFELSVETSQLLASYRLPVQFTVHYQNTAEDY